MMMRVMKTKTKRLKQVRKYKLRYSAIPLTVPYSGFLLDQPPDEEEDEDPERAAANALLDRQRLHEQELSSEEIARRLRERYARNDQIIEEFASVPQRMLMPSVNDANLWQIKVKVSL